MSGRKGSEKRVRFHEEKYKYDPVSTPSVPVPNLKLPL